MKTKSIQNIELKMETLSPESFRYRVLESAKDFKNSWLELGQYLFSVHKDKMFKEWGYLTFEAYCSKEVGVRQSTAFKLLKSYSFLEHEAPAYLKEVSSEDRKPSSIPSYESVNALRLARTSERVPESDYRKLKEEVLDNAREETEEKKKIRYILQANPPKDAHSASQDPKKRRQEILKKVLSQLRAAKMELAECKMPPSVLKELDVLIDALEEIQE